MTERLRRLRDDAERVGSDLYARYQQACLGLVSVLVIALAAFLVASTPVGDESRRPQAGDRGAPALLTAAKGGE